MATIYLRHPVHGAKVATLDLEADYDEHNGWERYTPSVESRPEETPNFETSMNALAPRRRKIRVQEPALFLNDTE